MTIGDAVEFRGIENLHGQSGNDLFVIHANGKLKGEIDGGAGIDSMDYSLFSTGVRVDLSLNSATAVGEVLDIENVIGSSSDDILIGDDGPNYLGGGDGDDALIGLGGDDILTGENGRDLLIGGTGADILLGGSKQDLLIGGSTVHDNNVSSIEAIMAEWTNPNHGRKRRLRFLSKGGGANGNIKLNQTTIIDDGVSDLLFGNQGQDSFWYGDEDILDASPGEL